MTHHLLKFGLFSLCVDVYWKTRMCALVWIHMFCCTQMTTGPRITKKCFFSSAFLKQHLAWQRCLPVSVHLLQLKARVTTRARADKRMVKAELWIQMRRCTGRTLVWRWECKSSPRARAAVWLLAWHPSNPAWIRGSQTQTQSLRASIHLIRGVWDCQSQDGPGWLTRAWWNETSAPSQIPKKN